MPARRDEFVTYRAQCPVGAESGRSTEQIKAALAVHADCRGPVSADKVRRSWSQLRRCLRGNVNPGVRAGGGTTAALGQTLGAMPCRDVRSKSIQVLLVG